MPVTVRAVSPINVSLDRLDNSVQRDELLCVANGTLSNLIRQLSSLSQNAEQLFSEIHREILKIDHTSNTLHLRLDRLSQKIHQPSSARSEQMSLEDNHMRKAFRSLHMLDQHSLDRQTLPTNLTMLYSRCVPPPDLNMMNEYRDDTTRDAISLYTYPGYFFDLWKEEMLKDVRRVSRSTGGNLTSGPPTSRNRRQYEEQPIYGALTIAAHQQRLQQPAIYQSNVLFQHNKHANNYRPVDEMSSNTPNEAVSAQMQHQNDQQPLHFPSEYEAPQDLFKEGDSKKSNIPRYDDSRKATDMFFTEQQQNVQRQPPAEAYSMQQAGQYQTNYDDSDKRIDMNFYQQALAGTTLPNYSGFLEHDEDDELPPPPPALSSQMTIIGVNNGEKGADVVSAGQVMNQMFSEPGCNIDAMATNDDNLHFIQMVPVATMSAMAEKCDNVGSEQIHNIPPPPPPPPSFTLENGRSGSFAQENCAGKTKTTESISNLMLDIQRGKQLKKVQMHTEMTEKRSSEGNDVAAILRRRMEHVLGNDDENEESNMSNDDAEWDDD